MITPCKIRISLKNHSIDVKTQNQFKPKVSLFQTIWYFVFVAWQLVSLTIFSNSWYFVIFDALSLFCASAKIFGLYVILVILLTVNFASQWIFCIQIQLLVCSQRWFNDNNIVQLFLGICELCFAPSILYSSVNFVSHWTFRIRIPLCNVLSTLI